MTSGGGPIGKENGERAYVGVDGGNDHYHGFRVLVYSARYLKQTSTCVWTSKRHLH